MSRHASGRTDRRLQAREVFAAPGAIALFSLAGLVTGLLGDGGWDVLSAMLLSVTLITLLVLRLTGRG